MMYKVKLKFCNRDGAEAETVRTIASHCWQNAISEALARNPYADMPKGYGLYKALVWNGNNRFMGSQLFVLPWNLG